jgi:hypothetical protein
MKRLPVKIRRFLFAQRMDWVHHSQSSTAMKIKLILGLASATLTYLVLAYIFMWPPVVTEYPQHPRPPNTFRQWAEMDNQHNLQQITDAINQWAQVNGKHKGDPVTLEQIKPYIKSDWFNKSGEIPVSTWGGTYSVTTVGAPPTCTTLDTNPPDMLIRVNHFYWTIISSNDYNWEQSHHPATSP